MTNIQVFLNISMIMICSNITTVRSICHQSLPVKSCNYVESSVARRSLRNKISRNIVTKKENIYSMKETADCVYNSRSEELCFVKKLVRVSKRMSVNFAATSSIYRKMQWVENHSLTSYSQLQVHFRTDIYQMCLS